MEYFVVLEFWQSTLAILFPTSKVCSGCCNNFGMEFCPPATDDLPEPLNPSMDQIALGDHI
jgi:hypothetical protein